MKQARMRGTAVRTIPTLATRGMEAEAGALGAVITMRAIAIIVSTRQVGATAKDATTRTDTTPRCTTKRRQATHTLVMMMAMRPAMMMVARGIIMRSLRRRIGTQRGLRCGR